MADPFPSGDIVRIIFERGLQLLRSESGWISPSSECLQPATAPLDFAAAHGVNRLVLDTHFHVPFFQPRRMFDPEGRPMSKARYLKGYVEDPERRVYKYMVEHHLFSAVAHLGYVAEAYGGLAVLSNEHRWSLPEHVRDASRSQLRESTVRHGEAVLASLVSALDASRFLVWRQNMKPPSDLAETAWHVADLYPDLLGPLVNPLGELWEACGDRLVAYRDCTVANHPFTELTDQPLTTLNDGDMWETFIPLPDNPEAKPKRFTFDDQIDLLTYAWETTCDVVRTVETLLPRVFVESQHLPRQGSWNWLRG